MRPLAVASALSLLITATPVRAATELIPLAYAEPQGVVDALASSLAPGGSIRVYQQQLLISTEPDNLVELKRLIALLDAAPRQLLITVRQPRALNQHSLTRAGSGVTPERHGTDGYGQTINRSHSLRSASGADLSIRALEGRRALLRLAAPVTLFGPGGKPIALYSGSSLWVEGRVSGQTVVLKLRSDHATGYGAGGMTAIDTQISGRLGQWLPVGGVAAQEQHSHTAFTGRSAGRHRTAENSAGSLSLKVDLL